MAVLLSGVAETKFETLSNGAYPSTASSARLWDIVDVAGTSTPPQIVSSTFGSLTKACRFTAGGGSGNNRSELRPTTNTSDPHHINGSSAGLAAGFSIFGNSSYLSQGKCYVDATTNTVYYYTAVKIYNKPSSWAMFFQLHGKGGSSPMGTLEFGGSQIRAGRRFGVSSTSSVNDGPQTAVTLHSSFTTSTVVYEFVVGFRLSTQSGGQVQSNGAFTVWTRQDGTGSWVKATPASWDNTQIGYFVNSTVTCGAYPKMGVYQSSANAVGGDVLIHGSRWADSFTSAASMAFAGGSSGGGSGSGSTGSGSASFVKKASTTVTDGTNLVLTPEGGAVSNGQQMLAAFFIDDGGATAPTIATLSGWTLLSNTTNANGERLQVFRKTASSEGTSYTFVAGGSCRASGVLVAYSGIAASPINTSAASTTSATLSPSSSSITPTVNGCTIASFFGRDTVNGDATQTFSGAGVIAKRAEAEESGSRIQIAAFDDDQTTAAAISHSATIGGTATLVMTYIVALAPASADTTPPAGVSSLVLSEPSAGTVRASFTMPADADTSNYAVRYKVGASQIFNNENDGTQLSGVQPAAPSAAVSFDASGFARLQTYTFAVFVRDTTGNWNGGTTANITLGDDVPPAEVSGLVGSISGSTVSLSFTAPADTDTAAYLIRYAVGAVAPGEIDGGLQFTAETAASASQVLTPSLGGLSGDTYSMRVFVRDTSGNWNAGSTITVNRNDTTPPAEVTDLALLEPSPGTIRATFTLPADPSATLTYRIRWKPSASATFTSRDDGSVFVADTVGVSGSEMSAELPGFLPGVVYKLAVFVADDRGNWNGGATAVITTTPADVSFSSRDDGFAFSEERPASPGQRLVVDQGGFIGGRSYTVALFVRSQGGVWNSGVTESITLANRRERGAPGIAFAPSTRIRT